MREVATGVAPPARVVTMRPEEERQHTDQVGMVVFLGSWAMMFGALFFAQALLRLRSPEWPPRGLPALPLLLPAVNTAVIAASSVALWQAGRIAARVAAGSVRTWLSAAIVLGSLFLGMQCVVWAGLWEDGLRPSSRSFGSLFYMLTVFHALHVLVGLGLLAWRLPSAWRGASTARGASSLRLASMFWHFVGVVWILIFASVYVA